MQFTHIIWDFDGTLFDTYPPLVAAIERALADLGVQGDSEQITAMLTITLAHTLQTLVDRHHLDADAFEARIDHYWAQIPITQRPPFPGAIRMCERFLAVGGANLIYTHRGYDSLMDFLDYYRVAHLFADVITGDAGYPRKPDPAGFIALIEKHDLPRECVLGVGDRDLDVLAAQGAGIRACLYDAVPSPGVQPDYVITTFDELDAIIGLSGS
ncbi:MAG: HAD hydrolase-like protein [Anaerolineae bacterium]|nr:HAD hydrolase-like protein [Anaerolineae bacterium]